MWALVLAFVLSLALTACGGGGESSEEAGGEGAEGGEGKETYEWRFVTEELDGQLQYEYAEEFAKRLKEKSDGRINMQVYEFGGLGSEVNQVEQLQNGAVEFAIVSPGFTGTMVKEGQIFALHYLLPTDQKQVHELLKSSEALNNDLAAKYEEHSIKPLAFWSEGAMQWTGTKSIQAPADFENFKMRTQQSPLILESYKAYGADPTAMSWSELYTSLDRGVVDGQENPLFFIEDASFHEVQSHLMLSNHNVYVAMTTVNPNFYNSLPEDVKGMVDETVNEMYDWVFDKQKEMNEAALGKIKEDTENPTEIVELSDEQTSAFKEKAMPVRDFYKNEVSTVNGEILNKLEKEIKESAGE